MGKMFLIILIHLTNKLNHCMDFLTMQTQVKLSMPSMQSPFSPQKLCWHSSTRASHSDPVYPSKNPTFNSQIKKYRDAKSQYLIYIILYEIYMEIITSKEHPNQATKKTIKDPMIVRQGTPAYGWEVVTWETGTLAADRVLDPVIEAGTDCVRLFGRTVDSWIASLLWREWTSFIKPNTKIGKLVIMI